MILQLVDVLICNKYQFYNLYFYQILLLRSSAPSLTYHSQNKLTMGRVVSIPLKTTFKDAVILEEVEKPEV